MLYRIVLIALIAAVFLSLALGLGVLAEQVGDWADLHPERQTLVWTVWNLGVLGVGIGLFRAWRWLRRVRKERARVPY